MAAASRQNRLFTLRLWQDETGDGQLEWRGKVQALPQGEICYFRSWAGLVERLEAMLIGETVVPPFNAREVRMSVESGSPGIAQGDPNPGRRVGYTPSGRDLLRVVTSNQNARQRLPALGRRLPACYTRS